VHDWSKYLPKDTQNAARQAKFRGRKRNSESNAPGNAEVTAEPSHARAGTRGVPSRPQEQEPCLHPSVAREDPAREPHLNGTQGTDGWMDDQSRITPTDVEEALKT
jgi:hypothetical protein